MAANKAKEAQRMLQMSFRMDVMASQIQANASNEQVQPQPSSSYRFS